MGIRDVKCKCIHVFMAKILRTSNNRGAFPAGGMAWHGIATVHEIEVHTLNP